MSKRRQNIHENLYILIRTNIALSRMPSLFRNDKIIPLPQHRQLRSAFFLGAGACPLRTVATSDLTDIPK